MFSALSGVWVTIEAVIVRLDRYHRSSGPTAWYQPTRKSNAQKPTSQK